MTDSLANEPLPILLRKVVCSARTGDYGNAASELNAALQSIQKLLAVHAADKVWVNMVAYSLETIYLMQQQNDWVAIADIIEYELAKLAEKSH